MAFGGAPVMKRWRRVGAMEQQTSSADEFIQLETPNASDALVKVTCLVHMRRDAPAPVQVVSGQVISHFQPNSSRVELRERLA